MLEFFGYKMIQALNADAVYARRIVNFTDKDEKVLKKSSDTGNPIKVIDAN